MTQVAEGVVSPATEIELQALLANDLYITPRRIELAEFSGRLVLAQQVGEDGLPLQITEPKAIVPNVSGDLFLRVCRARKEREARGEPLPTITMPAVLGRVAVMPGNERYFVLHRELPEDSTEPRSSVVLPYSTTPAADFWRYSWGATPQGEAFKA